MNMLRAGIRAILPSSFGVLPLRSEDGPVLPGGGTAPPTQPLSIACTSIGCGGAVRLANEER